jgi:hypothetical protein
MLERGRFPSVAAGLTSHFQKMGLEAELYLSSRGIATSPS